MPNIVTEGAYAPERVAPQQDGIYRWRETMACTAQCHICKLAPVSDSRTETLNGSRAAAQDRCHLQLMQK